MGELGERLAEAFLVRRGARVLARNLAAWPGEIDLLVNLAGAVVAVEVRTRVGEDPLESLSGFKEGRVRRSGMRLNRRPDRYDLVTVRLGGAGVDVRWMPGIW